MSENSQARSEANGENHVAEFAGKHGALLTRLFEKIDQSRDGLIERIREIAEIPAPTFNEKKRTEYIKEAFAGSGLNDIHSLSKGSVLGYTQARGVKDTLLLAAHIDHVFPHGTDLTTRIEKDILYGPGTGDNATNVAAIVEMARLFRELSIFPVRNIAFCGTVCEEGNGNLAGISEVLDSLGESLSAMIAVDGGASTVANRSLAIRRYVLRVRCPGGHSWGQFGTPSAVHEMARIITALAALEVPSEPRTSYNVGTIRGGTSVNAIAQSCEAEIDLRSLERESLEALEQSFLRIVQAARKEDVDVVAELIGDRPAAVIAPEHPLVSTALGAAQQLGLEVKLAASSTDAALPLSRAIPSISFGIYHGGRCHTLEEFVKLSSLTTGMKWLALTVLAIAGVED